MLGDYYPTDGSFRLVRVNGTEWGFTAMHNLPWRVGQERVLMRLKPPWAHPADAVIFDHIIWDGDTFWRMEEDEPVEPPDAERTAWMVGSYPNESNIEDFRLENYILEYQCVAEMIFNGEEYWRVVPDRLPKGFTDRGTA